MMTIDYEEMEINFVKKTYGHKYYVAASIGFEEKKNEMIYKGIKPWGLRRGWAPKIGYL